LELWKVQSPWMYDELLRDEMFPSASYQFVYYGMKGNTAISELNKNKTILEKKNEQRLKKAEMLFVENAELIQQLQKNLLPHRELIEKIKTYGLQTI